MNRLAFVTLSLASIVATPGCATARKNDMSIDELLTDFTAKTKDAATMTVRHVGALVSMRVELKIDALARVAPTAVASDRAVIDETIAAIRAASPTLTTTMSEQRWHLTFADGAGASLAVVTSSIFAPRHGTIEGHNVAFASDALIHVLAKHFAPDEAGLS